MANILIVEDDLHLRRIIALNLARHGYSVAEADSVGTANEACTVTPAPFDLILLDIDLPDGTGWDVLRQLTACAPAPGQAYPPVIVMTALRPNPSRIATFHPAGVLLKPFPIAALLQLIERVLKHTPAEQSSDDDSNEIAEGFESHHTSA